MKGLYLRLAWQGMTKNRKLYLPYLFTGSVMVMMYYLLINLRLSPTLRGMAGGDLLGDFILPLGSWVIALFSLLFLFYTHSFLMRRRTSEFGLYHVLGIEKKQLARILVWETLFSTLLLLLGGLLLGIAFSKLSELTLTRMIRLPVGYEITIHPRAIGQTALLFAGIFALLLLFALWRVLRSNPLALLHSDRVGEKPPRANWLVALLGAGLLALAYVLALSTRNPSDALLVFFLAVLLVILATYLLFVSGSVALCRALQKNRRYYYKANHFVSVSSMMYRMRRSGAGLASICILITMVLVMISSTSCLFIGAEDAVRARFPSELEMDVTAQDPTSFTVETLQAIRDLTQGLDTRNGKAYRHATLVGYLGQAGIVSDIDQSPPVDLAAANPGYVEFLSLEDYNRLVDGHATLAAGECLLYSQDMATEGLETFDLDGITTLRVKAVLRDFPTINGETAVMLAASAYVVTPELDELAEALHPLRFSTGRSRLSLYYTVRFDLNQRDEDPMALKEALQRRLSELPDIENARVSCREEGRTEFYRLYGSLFFLGIMLSIAFLFAAVLIIYYKQLSEGFEDQARFAIMQKVGMTRAAIRKSINSQMLTVFFLPLALAGVHLGFAYPMIWQLLQAFGLHNLPLVLGATAICYAAFCLFYALVYKLTANAYYGIVSGAKQ